MTTFGVTSWAVNRVSWAFGYGSYYNPYCGGDTVIVDNSVYDYSQPIVMTPDESSLSAAPDAPYVEPPQQAMTTFEKAQSQFHNGDYGAALDSVNAALKEMPNDTVVHEFRALVLFAQGKYQDAAATLYAVLSVGPGWDWTTMSSLYSSTAVYTEQLRSLEDFERAHPDDSAAPFVLAYHYITCGHNDAAVGQLKRVLKLQPKDELAATLLEQLDPEAKVPDQPEITEPPEDVNKVDSKALVGTWEAKRPSGETFTMSLDEKGAFDWTYSQDGNSQEVKGVYGVDKDGVLAMEMNDEGTMLAQLDGKGNNGFDFYMLGDQQGNEPLHFERQ